VVVPVPLFSVLDPADSQDYLQRVEPSVQGGRKMARHFADAIADAAATAAPGRPASELATTLGVTSGIASGFASRAALGRRGGAERGTNIEVASETVLEESIPLSARS